MITNFKIFESSKTKGKKTPIHKMFIHLPNTLDYRIILWIIQNWGDVYYQSPFGESFYSKEKNWDMTLENTLRLSDHWNFQTLKFSNKIHCKTNIPLENNTMWTIGKYDNKTETYNILISYPIINTEENKKKKREIIKTYLKDVHQMGIPTIYKNLVKLKDYVNRDILYAKAEKNGDVLYGKVKSIRRSKVNINDTPWNTSKFIKSTITFYNKDNDVIYIKPYGEYIN